METKISKLVSLTIIGLFLLISGIQATEFSSGLMLGYNGGPSFQINGSVGKFAQGFPFKMEIGAAYARMDAGTHLMQEKSLLMMQPMVIPKNKVRCGIFGWIYFTR